uniref:Acyltransferase n=1 Tax=Parasteatoda tepidariorum TaxID=114398 RepID=A0A2L2Y2A0_PARTP
MKFMGIEFAPLSIPLERRIQTLAVFYYCSNFLLLGFMTFAILGYLCFTQYYYIPLFYAIWFLYDYKTPEQGGRRWEWLRNWRMWKYFASYFPISLIKTADFDPNKNYIIGYHPHGLLGFGAFTTFGTEGVNFKETFPGITPRLLTLQAQFNPPLHREHIMCAGVCSASKESINWVLTREGKGNALVIVLGGAAEALDAHPGASLVPSFGFGENDLFEQVENPRGSALREWQDKIKDLLGFSTPIFHGRGIFQYNYGFLPYRKPINVVIGKPIDVEKIPHPTEEDINKLHQKYIDSLTALFEEHKVKYSPDVQLII